jgi:hypothetical protein
VDSTYNLSYRTNRNRNTQYLRMSRVGVETFSLSPISFLAWSLPSKYCKYISRRLLTAFSEKKSTGLPDGPVYLTMSRRRSSSF